MKATRMPGVKSRDLLTGAVVFKLGEPFTTEYGVTVNHVAASFGLETILGEGNTFAVFGCDADGTVMDWGAIFCEGGGPAWCLELMGV